MSVLEQVNDLLTNVLTTDFVDFLSDSLGIDSVEVSRAVKRYLGCNSTPASPTKRKENSPAVNVKAAITGNRTCIFKITRGLKAGQLCGTTIRGVGEFCSKHKNRKKETSVVKDPTSGKWVIQDTNYTVKSKASKVVNGRSDEIPLKRADYKKISSLGFSVV